MNGSRGHGRKFFHKREYVGPKVPVQLIKTHWGSEIQLHSFSALALDGRSGQTHAPVALALGKGLSVPTTGWKDSRDSLDISEVGSEPWTVQPMAKSLHWLHFPSSLCETWTPSKNSLLVTQFSSLHVTNILIHELLNDLKYTNNVSPNLQMTVNYEMKQMWMWTIIFCMQSGKSSNITSKKAATFICNFGVDITVTCFPLEITAVTVWSTCCNVPKLYTLSTWCIYGFCTIIKINSNYLSK